MANLTSFFFLTRKLILNRAESRNFLTICADLVEKRADYCLRGGELRFSCVIYRKFVGLV